MTSSPFNRLNLLTALLLIGLGLATGVMGLYVGEADDAPGAAFIGGLLTAVALVLGVKAARNRLSPWTARTALVLGAVIAAFAAFLTSEVSVRAVMSPPAEPVPSSVGVAPTQQYAAAVERARGLVRAAIAEQNLPGVSVAVGAGGAVVWTEGFGWRDVGTRTPVTPDTRFHIGTAASAVMPAAAALGLTHTGADAPKEWSPEAIGEEGEDAPPLTFLRHTVLQPLGLVPPEYPLPGDRATFYVPQAGNDPRRGRRLMYMRDLACCANGMAFSSTPSDLVRFALSTDAGSFNGELAGGQVMSVTTIPATGIVVAVTSNIAHANTSSLATAIAAAFAPGQ